MNSSLSFPVNLAAGSGDTDEEGRVVWEDLNNRLEQRKLGMISRPDEPTVGAA